MENSNLKIYITYHEFQIFLRMHVCKCFVFFFLDDICLTHSNIPTGRQSRTTPQYDIVEIHTDTPRIWTKKCGLKGLLKMGK